MATQGLRGAWTAQRNAADKTFWPLAIVRRPESRWFANPWQTPLVACDEPLVCTPRHMTSRADLEMGATHSMSPILSRGGL